MHQWDYQCVGRINFCFHVCPWYWYHIPTRLGHGKTRLFVDMYCIRCQPHWYFLIINQRPNLWDALIDIIINQKVHLWGVLWLIILIHQYFIQFDISSNSVRFPYYWYHPATCLREAWIIGNSKSNRTLQPNDYHWIRGKKLWDISWCLYSQVKKRVFYQYHNDCSLQGRRMSSRWTRWTDFSQNATALRSTGNLRTTRKWR